MKKYLLFIIGLILFINTGVAQDEKELLAQIFEEDRTAIDALVLYPKETRLAILKTATYPQALIKLERIQQKTSNQFQAVLEQESKATQQIIWDLTRYPNLVNRLRFEAEKKKNIERVLQNYPSVIHERAKEARLHHYDLLVQIDELDQSAKRAFGLVLKDYPVEIQESLSTLIELPEVMTLLTDNIQLTILVGDLYQKEPAWLISQSDSLHQAVNALNEEELQEWQERLENDPKALGNLKEASQEFAKENGYDDLYYEPETDDDLYYYDEPEEDYERTTRVEHHYYHYPYWYGYPTWYVYARWRPYPLWWDWGFYIRPHNRVTVFVGLPSFHFTNWFFYHPRHHYYYPHLTNHFVRHTYHRPRTHHSPVRGAVYSWRDRNKGVITTEWLTNENRRLERIREFGRFENARQDYNRRNPNRKVDQTTYLKENELRYPRIKTKTVEREVKKTIKKKTPTKRPPVKVETNRRKLRTTIKRTVPSKKRDKNTTIKRIERARDYHKRTWDSSKRKVTKQRTPSKRSTIKKRRPSKRTPKKTTKKRNSQ